jgi:hypothetical protein
MSYGLLQKRKCRVAQRSFQIGNEGFCLRYAQTPHTTFWFPVCPKSWLPETHREAIGAEHLEEVRRNKGIALKRTIWVQVTKKHNRP